MGVARDGLGVVAGAHRDHPGLTFPRRELGEAVGRAALLEGAGGVEVVKLQQHPGAGGAGNGMRLDQGGTQHRAGDARGGRAHVGQRHVPCGQGGPFRPGAAPYRNRTAVISTERAPPGAGTSTLSPTLLPSRARARGEEMEIEPFFMSASYWPTMR